MNFLVDESVDAPIAHRLSSDGHNVKNVCDSTTRGMTDEDVLKFAAREEAILVTADRDFGELIFRVGRAHHGVLLIRLAGLSQDQKSNLVSQAISEHGDEMHAAFTVITPGVVRIRVEPTQP